MWFSILTFLIISFAPSVTTSSIVNSIESKEQFLRSNLAVTESGTRGVDGMVAKAVQGVKILNFPQLPSANNVSADEEKKGIERKNNSVDFELLSSSGIAVETKNNTVLFAKSPDSQRSIASITKLMTAMVFLDVNPGWESVYRIQSEDKREGGIIFLFTGDEIKIKDLFYSSLIASDNVATVALVHSTGFSEEEFVVKMNEKAKSMGLKNTVFIDSTGLNNNNVSTAREVVVFAQQAFANKEIRDVVLKKEYQFTTIGGRQKKVVSTDYLLDVFPDNGIKILGGKTGYNNSAGYCFTGKFTDFKGNEIITVVLGDEGKNSRFEQTYNLANWIYKNYNWRN